jgi:hypothetical protein
MARTKRVFPKEAATPSFAYANGGASGRVKGAAPIRYAGYHTTQKRAETVVLTPIYKKKSGSKKTSFDSVTLNHRYR